VKKVSIQKPILNANDRLAQKISAKLDGAGVFAVNVMASPGAGKTSLILATVRALKKKFNTAVIEGDVVPVDVDRIKKLKVPAIMANTGGACHLDAVMVQKALSKLRLQSLDLLIIENVGNLICPMNFKLGSHLNVVIASVPEGADKPYKYPGMFKGAQVLILNKADYLKTERFNLKYFKKGVRLLNPNVKFFTVSAKTGEGIDDWISWLDDQVINYRFQT